MKKVNCLLFFSILSHLAIGQDYYEQFQRSNELDDTLRQQQILNEWDKADPDNAELFVCYFNYYFNLSRQSMLSLTTAQPKGESLAISDSNGNTVGYIGDQYYYDKLTLDKGLQKIDQGINRYPDRLDMRFGKIFALGLVEEWELFTNEIIKAVQRSGENKNKWEWSMSEPVEDGEEFFLTSMQTYQQKLYNTENDDLLVNMRSIASEILRYYPEHVESLSNISVTYLLTKEYDKGLEPLLRAEEIDSTDAIVLANIAQAYKLKEDKPKAILYYEKVIQYGDPDMIAYARQEIKALKD